jgi:uncharacterized protein (TIGR02246 family)
MTPTLEEDVKALYRAILEAWNAGDADAFSTPFADDGQVVGFDGSEITGRARISDELAAIFTDHPTGSYVGIVRGVQALGADAALLRAVSGIVPAGKDDLEPSLNATQTLIARRENGGWRVVLYQNTPAQYHGRPEAVKALTEELRAAL